MLRRRRTTWPASLRVCPSFPRVLGIGRDFVRKSKTEINMPFQEFQIDFTYDAVYYQGLVRPIAEDSQMSYRVMLENENQEASIDVILRPSRSQLDDWEFECPDGKKAEDHFDKDLLTEIGEQVEAYLIRDSQSRETAGPVG